MSENAARQDIVSAIYRLDSNLDTYGRGYKEGRKDEREHAKTLRDPDRLAEIHDLQEALRKKNEKIRGYLAALELNTRGRHTAYQLGVEHGKATRPRRPRAHAYIERVGGPGLLWDEYWWEATIMRGPRWHNSGAFSTHAGALAWALAQLKEVQ